MTPEIDAAVKEYRESEFSSDPQVVINLLLSGKVGTIVNAYLSLTDPTPITPELLDCEPGVKRHGSIWIVPAIRSEIVPSVKRDVLRFQSGGSSIRVKTMGGVRLAMMQARESVK